MATSVAGTAVAVVIALVVLRSSPSLPTEKTKRIHVARLSQPASQSQPKSHAPNKAPQPIVKAEEPRNTLLADIDKRDYEVVADLDDLMALYETSLWDENSSL